MRQQRCERHTWRPLSIKAPLVLCGLGKIDGTAAEVRPDNRELIPSFFAGVCGAVASKQGLWKRLRLVQVPSVGCWWRMEVLH